VYEFLFFCFSEEREESVTHMREETAGFARTRARRESALLMVLLMLLLDASFLPHAHVVRPLCGSSQTPCWHLSNLAEAGMLGAGQSASVFVFWY
jgi:hypothetical protein